MPMAYHHDTQPANRQTHRIIRPLYSSDIMAIQINNEENKVPKKSAGVVRKNVHKKTQLVIPPPPSATVKMR